MTKIKRLSSGIVGLFIFAVLSVAHAQTAPVPDALPSKEHVGQHIGEIFSQLNLTDDQKRQLDANKEQHRSRMQQERQAIKADKEALRAELMKPQLDMVRINVIHSQIKSLQDQMEDDKLNSILAVRAILTPDQFSKFVSLMRKHKQEHAE